jgi:hypothetical protein
MDINLSAILQLVETLALLGGGFTFMLRAGKSAGKVETLLSAHHDDIVGLRDELKEIRPTLTAIAVQKTQIDNINLQIGQLTKWYDELRHGQGFVIPLESKRV